MKKDYYNVIVLMSGTSLNAVDLIPLGIQGSVLFACAWSFEITKKIKVLSSLTGVKMDLGSDIIYKFQNLLFPRSNNF